MEGNCSIMIQHDLRNSVNNSVSNLTFRIY